MLLYNPTNQSKQTLLGSSFTRCLHIKLLKKARLFRRMGRYLSFRAKTLFLLLPFGALDKREYLAIIRDNFCASCIKTYVVTPHLNHLNEMVQMRGHNLWF